MIWMSLDSARAQDSVVEVARVEITADPRDRWRAYPLGGDGVLVVGDNFQTSEVNYDRRAVTFTRYDRDLGVMWTQTLRVPGNERLDGASITPSDAWFLLHRGRSDEVGLVRLPLGGGEPVTTWVEAPGGRALFNDLVVSGDDAWIAAESAALGPTRISLLRVDLTTNTVYPVDVVGAVDGIDPDARGRLRFDDLDLGLGSGPNARPRSGDVALAMHRVVNGHRTVYLATLVDAQVGQVVKVAPPAAMDVNLLGGTLVPTENGDPIVVGTYALGARGVWPQGVYMGTTEGASVPAIQTTSFTSFAHFLDHLTEAQRQSMHERIEARGADVKLSYIVAVQEPAVLEDQIVLLFKAHDPSCAPLSCTFVDAAGFERTGARAWDTGAPLITDAPASVAAAVQVHGDHVTVVYSTGHRYYLLFTAGSGPRRLVARDVAPGAADSSGPRPVDWWYDDWFVMSGFESHGGDTVFALTKLGPQ